MLASDTFLKFTLFGTFKRAVGGGGGFWFPLTVKLGGKIIYISGGGVVDSIPPSQLHLHVFSCTIRLFSVLGKWIARARERSAKFFWRLPSTGKAGGKDNIHIRVAWYTRFTPLNYFRFFFPRAIRLG